MGVYPPAARLVRLNKAKMKANKRKYLRRDKFVHLGGLWCASQINKAYRLAKKHGYELPEKIKPAIKFNGEVFEAKHGESRHPHIADRIGIPSGQEYECGFTYLEVAA